MENYGKLWEQRSDYAHYLRRHLEIFRDCKSILFIGREFEQEKILNELSSETPMTFFHIDDDRTPQEIIGSLSNYLLSNALNERETLCLFAPPFAPFNYWRGWDFLQYYLAINNYTASYFLPSLYYEPVHSYLNSVGIYLRGLDLGDYLEFGTYVGNSLSKAGQHSDDG